MRDLDMSDVLADAQDMLDQHLWEMYRKLEVLPTEELEHNRYWARIRAHEEGDIYELRAIDDILLMRVATTICEGCRGYGGCDMCSPPEYNISYDYPMYDPQADHYERFGRPVFPNEY